MSAEFLILLIVIVTALAFDFTNGFHDTANAMATSIATGALKPRAAVALSALLNLVGAFLSVAVAATVAKGIVRLDGVSGQDLLIIVFAGLVGGILWNLLTWLFGLPSSSSHALFGGLIGATVAALGWSGVIWASGSEGVLTKIVLPAVLAPVVAALVSGIGTWSIYRVTRGADEDKVTEGFRWGQIGSASLVSLAHGTNDAQKTMGVIFLALVAHGTLTANSEMPLWVMASCAVAIAAGTYLGGWRIIRTLGKGLVEIDSPQGLAAESSSAAIILTSAHFGLPLSTTQTATGSILGSGIGKGAEVRWGVMGRMVVAWTLTLPLAGIVGATCWVLAHVIGGLAGVLVVFAILLVLSTLMYLRSRRNPVDRTNVNEWPDDKVSAETPSPADALDDAAVRTTRIVVSETSSRPVSGQPGPGRPARDRAVSTHSGARPGERVRASPGASGGASHRPGGSSAVPPASNGTVPPVGSGVIPPAGSGAVPPVGSGAVPPVGSGPISPAGSSGVPPASNGTVPSVGGGTVPLAGSSAIPPVGGGTVPLAGSSAIPPVGSSAVPPAGGAIPAVGSGAVPPVGSGAIPPTGNSAVPPVDGGAVPPAGNSTRPLADDEDEQRGR